MPDFISTNGHTQVVVPLRIKPFSHQAMPTITGSAFSNEAGTVLYGNYNMEYLLPGGDRIRLIANHNKKTVQLLLLTHDAQLLTRLPGDRPSSLVADVISKINHYRIRSDSYARPLSNEQKAKIELANQCINSLTHLLKQERRLAVEDYIGHESLRRKVIALIEKCRDGNRMIANNPIISEGTFGAALYDACKTAQQYHFNRVHRVSRQDQMDFSKIEKTPLENGEKPCFVWDSELHVGHNGKDLDDALRVICQHYQLNSAQQLNNTPANRFSKLEIFIRSLWRDGHDWINYLAIETKPTHQMDVEERSNGVAITKITPYYTLNGLHQQGYSSLNELVSKLSGVSIEPIHIQTEKEAASKLGNLENGHWAINAQSQHIILRMGNKLNTLHYFLKDGLFYPLPDGEDLYILSQVSKRHLYLPERLGLRLKAFGSRIPVFFQNFYIKMREFLPNLYHDFMDHVHTTHELPSQPTPAKLSKKQSTLHDILENKGLLANGQTLEEFIQTQIKNSPYIIARANHPPSPHAYENPLHRIFDVVRHVGSFFVDTSALNPMIGTLAMAAYFYGAGAILAPDALSSLLTKLHLGGLIYGIEPTQKLAHLMSHGTVSEAISASVTLWQGMVATGSLDKFFVEAVSLLKDDPGEIAIIAALALSLGYGLTKALPVLQKEMGDFPYTNYAALGGKGGAAVYDTIMHPGDDWLLGTCKWLCRSMMTLAKLSFSPFVEAYHYGYQNGFVNGWRKSGGLVKRLSKQFLAAITDLLLALLTVPLLEVCTLLIHVPFRGITNFFRKILALLGNFGPVGDLLINIAQRPSTDNFIAEFRLSPLYGFTSPFGHFSDNLWLNIGINSIRFLFLPPLQLIKNIIILPLTDALALLLRVSLAILNPASRVLAYFVGTVLYQVGRFWDKSIGILFSTAAVELTELCNSIENAAGELRQGSLSFIEIQRNQLYHWAFHEEDLALHQVINDQHYYITDPRRCELLPHKDTYCLLKNLLHNGSPDSSSSTEKELDEPYQKLFVPKEQKHKDKEDNILVSSASCY